MGKTYNNYQFLIETNDLRPVVGIEKFIKYVKYQIMKYCLRKKFGKSVANPTTQVVSGLTVLVI